VLTSSRRQRKAGAGGPIHQATCSRGAPPLGAKQGQELAAWQEHWAAWPLDTKQACAVVALVRAQAPASAVQQASRWRQEARQQGVAGAAAR